MSRLLQRWAVLTAAMLVAVLAIPLAVAAQSTPKTYVAEVAPHVVAAGSTASFTATLTNLSTQQQLGSANLTAPEELTLLQEPGEIPVQPRGTASVRGDVLELRDLSLLPSETATVRFSAQASCGAGTSTWQVVAKQANNFNGPPGNDFQLDSSDERTDLTLDVACGLAFIEQPNDAQVGKNITSVQFDPQGPAIKVAFVDGTGVVLEEATGLIELAVVDKPPHTLEGTTSVEADKGVASFEDVRISQPGLGYQLTATSDGPVSADSESFSVWEAVTSCDAHEPCTAQVAREQSMDIAMTGTSREPALLLASIGARSELECEDDTATHAPEVVTVDSPGFTGEKTVVLTIAKEAVMLETNNGAAHYAICYEGDDGKPPYVLDACGTPPCLVSKKKTGRGDVVITMTLPGGDPHFY